MSYAEKDLIENIKRLEAENESWRKQFRQCAIELASAEAENAKLRAVVEAAKTLLSSCCEDDRDLHGMLEVEDALKKLEEI